MQIRIRDVDYHYEEVGTGRPLLLMHGGGSIGSARWALELYEELYAHRSGWRRIYLDQMGHGETPAPSWLTGMDDTIGMTIEFMEAVAPGQRFAIGGVSWGGYIARGVLHHYASHIDGAFFWSPNYRYIESDPHLPAQQIFKREPGFKFPDGDWLAGLMIEETEAAWAEARRSILRGGANNPGTPAFYFGHGFSFDPDDLAEPFPGPVLLVAGRQDNITGYEVVTAAMDKFPRGTHVVLDRCGHLMSVDQPVLLKALANEWLDRVEEYVKAR